MKDHIQKMQTGGDIVAAITSFVEQAKKINDSHNYLTVITEAQAIEQAKIIQKQALTKKFPLAGLPFTVKHGICVKDVDTSASSAILKGYKPLFNATAVQKMIDAGAIFIGKTVQDEFGFGALGITQGKGYTSPTHPDDPELCCGGSSSGSGGFTKKMPAHASLGESTGGSIEAPAAFCGVVGLCPTYSRVSRHGLLDYGTSLDKIGPITKTLPEAATILNVIAGHDAKDETSSNEPVPDYEKSLGNIKGLRIARIKEAFTEGVDESIKNAVHEKLTELEKQGATVREVSLPLLKQGIATYYTIGLSEASTNLAKYCGMRYGQSGPMNATFDEYFTKIRTEHFGEEAKRRVLIGTFARMAGYRDAFYNKALRVRTKIIEDYKKAFKACDVLCSPTMPMLPPKKTDAHKLTPLQHLMCDVLTVGPNLAGLPHVSVPAGKAGIMFIADHFKEEDLFRTHAE